MVFNGPCYLRGMGNVTRMNNSLQSPQKGDNCLGKSLHIIGISRDRLNFSLLEIFAIITKIALLFFRVAEMLPWTRRKSLDI